MNTKILIYSLFLLLASQARAEEATCRYFNQFIGGNVVYSCELFFNGHEGSQILTIGGNHMADRTNADVLAIVSEWFANSTTFPNVICSHFPNLENVRMVDVGFTALDSQTVSQCQNLQVFQVFWNNISSIPADIFANNRNLTTVDLASNRLASLPEGIFDGLSQIRNLDIGNNQLASLPIGLLRDLVNLDFIGLWFNQFRTLDAQWFETNTNLRSLDISWNQIQTLDASDFATITGLTSFFISGNLLTAFNHDAFLMLQSILDLDVSFNFIASLPEGAFDGLSTIIQLRLQGNGLEVIGNRTFTGLPALQILDLNTNRIREVRAGAFEGLGNLSTLRLSFNQIEEFPTGIFAPFAALSTLTLWNNRVNRISRDMFTAGNLTSLDYFDLEGNQMNVVDRRIFDDATNLRVFHFFNNLCASFSTQNFNLNRAQHMQSLAECFRNFDFDTGEVITDNNDSYDFRPATDPGMLIRVQASGEIHIALTPHSFPWQPMVEILIGTGGNARSEIRRNQASIVAVAHTPNIVNATGDNDFTVTWANQLILVSRTGENFPFLGYMMEDFFRIHYFGLRTPTSRGVWNIRPF